MDITTVKKRNSFQILRKMTFNSALFAAISLLHCPLVDGLMVPSSFPLLKLANASSRRQSVVMLPLGYKNYNKQGNDDGDNNSPINTNKPGSLTVPVLGPIPNAGPLVIGGEMTLEPPTPLQWQALEECVTLHQKYLQVNTGVDTITGIDAAPLVAIIDDVSGQEQVSRPTEEHKPGRYATLAAVVGISSLQQQDDGLDMTDESSFMESIMRASTNKKMVPLNSRIRLVGIGRAVLRDFFHKLPSEIEDQALIPKEELLHNENHGDSDDNDDNYNNIVMAKFIMLTDTSHFSSASFDKVGIKGARSPNMSPVHMLAELSRISNRLIWIHDDRRRLVAGLVAAKTRLAVAKTRQNEGVGGGPNEGNSNSNKNNNLWDDDLQDWDGFGQLEQSNNNMKVDREEDAEAAQAAIIDLLMRVTDEHHVHVEPDGLRTKDQVTNMDNYGLNYYSAFSSLPDLRKVALSLFEPYYSKDHREEEEYELETLSFVAFRALEGFISADEMAWALRCTNTIERLQKATEHMMEHKILLENLAEDISEDLQDCGEECTDLW
mmetsp:Transcript_26598/g.37458  ORF Transcript_26598/g.37458 Transcript_26598/m.37458 type:complete len:549 (+) Transcript_26598:337-1983(+)